MAATVTISRAMAVLLLRDLPRHLAAAEQAGIAPPKLSLQYGDGLSRSDAAALRQWAMKIPVLGKALHGGNAEVRAFEALTRHFEHQHPQRPDGSPEAWDEPISPALAGLALGTRERIEAGELHPSEARAAIGYFDLRPDLARICLDKGAEGHRALADELRALHQRAAEPDPAAADADLEDDESGVADMSLEERVARIVELDTALRYGKMSSADRPGLVEELSALRASVPVDRLPPIAPRPEGGPPRPYVVAPAGAGLTAKSIGLTERLAAMPQRGSIERQAVAAELHRELSGGSAPGGRNVRAEIAARLADKDFNTAYMDKRHIGHEAAVAEMRGLHEAAAAEAAPAATE